MTIDLTEISKFISKKKSIEVNLLRGVFFGFESLCVS